MQKSGSKDVKNLNICTWKVCLGNDFNIELYGKIRDVRPKINMKCLHFDTTSFSAHVF